MIAAETALSVSSARVTGRTVVLRLKLHALHGEDVAVGYTGGALQDLRGTGRPHSPGES